MKNQKPRAYIPIYAFAVAWIVCAFFIPMYTLAGLAGSAAVSAAAAVVAYYTAGFILSKRPAKAEPEPEPVKKEEPALSPEVQAIIDDGKRAMKEMGRLYSSIKNNDVRKRINELMRVSDKIVQDAVDDPSDVPQIRKFLMSSIEDMLDTAIDAFKKQLDSLFANQALDIETDISVMNQMLAREGLSDDDADTIIKAARSGKTE